MVDHGCAGKVRGVAEERRRVAFGAVHANPARPAQPISLPFEGRHDTLWSLLIGEDAAATREAFVSGKGYDCGIWWFYVDELVYRLPLAEKAAGATCFAVLAALSKHRNTGEPMHILTSGDGTVWIKMPLLSSQMSEHLFAIPKALRGGRDLFVKVKSFGYGADTYVDGFALCR